MLPLAVGLGGTAAIACLAGVYYGSMFGGAITSILLGIPGDAPSVMTVLDGYPMAQKGEAGRALGISCLRLLHRRPSRHLQDWSSLSVPVSRAALAFGPTEMTAMMCFALSLAQRARGPQRLQGLRVVWRLASALGMVGARSDRRPRRAIRFGPMDLFDGLDFSIVAVGLFGLTAIFMTLDVNLHQAGAHVHLLFRSLLPRISDAVSPRWQLLQGLGARLFRGCPSWCRRLRRQRCSSYALAKRLSATPAERIGTGIVEGVAAPEAANNSASYGADDPAVHARYSRLGDHRGDDGWA